MDDKHSWWEKLEPQWKKAYNETIFNKGPKEETPSAKELDDLLSIQVLRMVGPQGSHSNISFELTNLSGLPGLDKLQILIVTDHQISSVEELSLLAELRSIFLIHNQLKSLKGLESLNKLEMLHVNVNFLEDLAPISELSSLRLLNCAYNKLNTLSIPKNIKELYCLPNEDLPDSEIIRIERNKGIRCRRG